MNISWPLLFDWLTEQDTADQQLADQLSLTPWFVQNQLMGWISQQQLAKWPALNEWWKTDEVGRLVFQKEWNQTTLLAFEKTIFPLHKLGAFIEWRNERFAVLPPDIKREGALTAELQLERGLFRSLGLTSRAVHLNAWVKKGEKVYLWVAKRSERKQVDPGKLDNTMAGGVAGNESISEAILREAWEEAGLTLPTSLPLCHECLALRVLPEGLHREWLWIQDVEVDANWQPENQDGEVSDFQCLPLSDVIEKIQNGAFTRDAALTIVSSLVHRFGASESKTEWVNWLEARKIAGLRRF
ncbi:NUDIX domain-containing protein [Leeia sp. TBRC 13508]|uniref:NUDIX domain-containing protein n=1 Tax=Leeia speluncae TaxID=2884804 RepID=A0ABS8D7Q8_9NEIS|nr:NUDIX domain-containing protein [Leeia speluncae]MCB6184239.1 NUDIX domain-containing protein [Leeia speluncae]